MSMRALILTACLAASAGAPVAHGQHAPVPPMADAEGRTDEGLGLIERGIGMIMRNLWDEVGPDLNRLGEDMSGALSRMAPVIDELAVLVDDLSNYQPPQRLENGDVIIRRKPGAPPPPPFGDSLREFSAPHGEIAPTVPRNPYAPEIEL